MVISLKSVWERRQEAYLRRKSIREQAIAYKGGACNICGYVGFPSIFDFHHVDRNTKDFTISKKVTSFEAIKSELEKCVLLCCRCHREVHEGLHPGYLELDSYSYGDELELDEL